MFLSLYIGKGEASWGPLRPLESRSLPGPALSNSENSKHNTNRCLKNLPQIRESRYLTLAYSHLFPESPSIWGISQREKVLEAQKAHRDLLQGAADFGPTQALSGVTPLRAAGLQEARPRSCAQRSPVHTPREGRTALMSFPVGTEDLQGVIQMAIP